MRDYGVALKPMHAYIEGMGGALPANLRLGEPFEGAYGAALPALGGAFNRGGYSQPRPAAQSPADRRLIASQQFTRSVLAQLFRNQKRAQTLLGEFSTHTSYQLCQRTE